MNQRNNFIPKSRQYARSRRVHIRFWIVTLLVYALFMVVSGVIYHGTAMHSDLAKLKGELAEYNQQATQLMQEAESLRPKVIEQKRILEASRSISDQPDWSMLLTYLADGLLDDQVILKTCSLAHTQAAAAASTQPGRGSSAGHESADLVMILTGYAKTAPDVSGFILRLEQFGLFDKVTLVKTNREPYLNDQAISFEVHCVMNRRGGAS
ncbi:MAG: hypothetical protein Kow00105_04390 [Phycisphaeraceae bacterium]